MNADDSLVNVALTGASNLHAEFKGGAAMRSAVERILEANEATVGSAKRTLLG